MAAATAFQEEKLQVVILKCPYANWQNPKTQKTFCDMVSLKLTGYHSKHFFGVMPIDGTDFLCDHILVCREDPIKKQLVPIMGVKSFLYDYAAPFFTDFTIEAFLKKGGHTRHLASLHEILARCKAEQKRIAYYSSWTVEPEAGQDRPLMKTLKELFAALTYLHHEHEGISELLGLGVPKYRTDLFFQQWGFERVKYRGEDLENIPFRILGGIDGVFIHLQNYTEPVISAARKYQTLWESRITLGVSPQFHEHPLALTPGRSDTPSQDHPSRQI